MYRVISTTITKLIFPFFQRIAVHLYFLRHSSFFLSLSVIIRHPSFPSHHFTATFYSKFLLWLHLLWIFSAGLFLPPSWQWLSFSLMSVSVGLRCHGRREAKAPALTAVQRDGRQCGRRVNNNLCMSSLELSSNTLNTSEIRIFLFFIFRFSATEKSLYDCFFPLQSSFDYRKRVFKSWLSHF